MSRYANNILGYATGSTSANAGELTPAQRSILKTAANELGPAQTVKLMAAPKNWQLGGQPRLG